MGEQVERAEQASVFTQAGVSNAQSLTMHGEHMGVQMLPDDRSESLIVIHHLAAQDNERRIKQLDSSR